MVGGTLALGLDEERHIYQVLSIPRSEWSQFLQAVAIWSNYHLNVSICFARSDEALVFYSKSLRREGETSRRIELHAIAILI